MNTDARRTRVRLAVHALTVAAALAAGACSSEPDGNDRSDGTGEPVVLQLANTSSELSHQPAVQHFADLVEELSGRDLRIEPVNEWGNFEADAEQQVVLDVAEGAVDLGWVGSRVFDTMDVETFAALTAPMLVDSYALQAAVIHEGITDEMMNGLDELGVIGLGVLPDMLRKPIGVAGPIVTTADWQGITFGTLSSNLQADAISALGATPARVFGHERAEALDEGLLDGFEFGLDQYHQNPDWLRSAPYVTANVNLWPQMDVVIADPDRLDQLSAEQRSWIDEAAEVAAADSGALAETDAESVGRICDAGARFATASDADMADLREAFAAVYDRLEEHTETRTFINRIRVLKESTPAEGGLDIPAGCTGPAATQAAPVEAGDAPAELNGSYRYVLTQEDADAVGDPDDNYPVTITIELTDGQMEGGCFEHGSYAVEGDRITFHSDAYDSDITATFSRDEEGTLVLTPVPPVDPGDAFVCFAKPWVKVA